MEIGAPDVEVGTPGKVGEVPQRHWFEYECKTPFL